jgi:hypothetical protein
MGHPICIGLARVEMRGFPIGLMAMGVCIAVMSIHMGPIQVQIAVMSIHIATM